MQKAAPLRSSGSGAIVGAHYGPADQLQPAEKQIGDKLMEVHEHLDQAAETLARVDSKLTGANSRREDCVKSAIAEKQAPPLGIEELVRSASTKADCLAGLARTINERL